MKIDTKKNIFRLSLLCGRNIPILFPYLWLIIFFLIPFIIILEISFATTENAIPPYQQMFTFLDNQITIYININNYLFLIQDSLYISAYLASIKMAFISACLCLLLGYPMAYAVFRANITKQLILLFLLLLPSWTSLVIRVYSWMGLLSHNGLINNFLLWLGLVDYPVTLLNTDIAVYIGIVYSYLPFMFLPIYASLSKQNITLLAAAADLGAKPWKSFLSITLPLSKTGVITGFMLVFIPVTGEYVIPELLGGSDSIMIGRLIWQEYFYNRDWPMASALACVMLIILSIPVLFFHKYKPKHSEA